MAKTIVEFETSHFDGGTNGHPLYTLYFFYVRKKIDREWCWVWDEDKLLLEDALKKYPLKKYEWVEFVGD
jgi:uncharacterized protein with ParB-like and HNH nuclease domain